MSNQTSLYPTNGNVAYQPTAAPKRNQAVIIAFPGNASQAPQKRKRSGSSPEIRTTSPAHAAKAPQANTRKAAGSKDSRLQDLLFSSEMYCSLKFESLSGVKIGQFSSFQIAGCFAICIALSAVALVMGM